jgi:hypothetical protein
LNTVQEIDPQALALLQSGVDDVVLAAKGFLIQTDNDLVRADEILSRAKKGRRFIKDAYAEMLEAARTSVRAAEGVRGKILDRIELLEGPLAVVENSMKSAMTFYEAERRRKQREIAAREAKEAEEARKTALRAQDEEKKAIQEGSAGVEKAQAESFAADFLSTAPQPVRIEPVRPAIKTTFAEVWAYEVEDISKLPVRLIRPNPDAIQGLMAEKKAALKALLEQGVSPITLPEAPGIVFFTTMGARGKSGT